MSDASIFGEGCDGKAGKPHYVSLAKGLFGALGTAPCNDRTALFGAAHRRGERLQSKSSASFTART